MTTKQITREVKIRERGVTFDAPDVQALRLKRKTQHRFFVGGPRVSQPVFIPGREGNADLWSFVEWDGSGEPGHHIEEDFEVIRKRMIVCCPHGRVGDRLWIKEAHVVVPATAYRGSHDDGVPLPHRTSPDGHSWAVYKEGWTRCRPACWKSGAVMPRWASRFLLEIQDVRVEQVQDINVPSCLHEGCYPYSSEDVQDKDLHFPTRWNMRHKGNPDAQFEANPWVYVLDLKEVEA